MKQHHLTKLLSKKVTTIVDVIGKREAVIYRVLPLSCARVRQLYLLDSLLHAPTHLMTAVVLSNTMKGARCIYLYYIDIRMTLIHLQRLCTTE
jgi:hypothetical protein